MSSLFRNALRHSCTVKLLTASLFVAFISTSAADARNRTLKLHFTHTGERGEFTYKRNGRYDQAVLKKLNHILRDWRRDEATKMDPRLFDIIWEVYREVGGRDYIHIVSGFRSVKTNDMLRRRGRGVAKSSLHTRGQAMDFYIPGVSVTKIRNAGLRLHQGGVGYYPKSGSPFVHLDTGRVRHWPRMTRQQLAAVFPNGQTLHVPSDGKPLKGYEIAKARQAKSSTTAVAYLDSETRSIRPANPGTRPTDADEQQADRRKGTVVSWLKKTLAGGADEEEDNLLANPQAEPQAEPQSTVVAEAADAPPATAPLPRILAPADRQLAVAVYGKALLVARADQALPEESISLDDRLQPIVPPTHSQDQIKLTRLLAQASLRADEARNDSVPVADVILADASPAEPAVAEAMPAQATPTAETPADIILADATPATPTPAETAAQTPVTPATTIPAEATPAGVARELDFAVAATMQPETLEIADNEAQPGQLEIAGLVQHEPLEIAGIVQSETQKADTAVYSIASGPSTSDIPVPAPREVAANAIDAANAIGSARKGDRTLTSTSENTVALAYATFTPELSQEPKKRPNPAALIGPKSRPLLTRPEVEVTDAAIEEAEDIVDWENPIPQIAEPAGVDFAQFMGARTTRTDAFVALAMPQPWSYPALFDAPQNVFDASRIQSGLNLRFDRFASAEETFETGRGDRYQRLARIPDRERFLRNF